MTDEKEIVEMIIDRITPRCPRCNAIMSSYPFYDEWGAYGQCPKCQKWVRK
jgi:tRNA(Ile2) C34 agmatinyltransferase TiaS